jgi:hypothetical protein
MRQIEKSRGFKSGEYGRKSTVSRIPLTSDGWSWWCGPALNQSKDVFSIRICLSPEDHMLSLKLLVDAGVDMFTNENQPSGA